MEIISTSDRWEFFNAISALFFNALKALGKMEDMYCGEFASPVTGEKYSFLANAKGSAYRLTLL